MFEWTPSVDDQGQILYARWDYVDRHNMPYMSLWSTMPDGTDARAVFGNYTLNPHCVFEARRVPDSRKVIFTASGHHAMTGGSLVLLDPNRGADGDGPMQRLTPEVVFPESEGWPRTYFANPYPLSESFYLVAWSAAPLPPGTPRPQWGMPGPPNDLGIYLFDTFGNLELLYRDPEISSMDPLPIRPRQKPPQLTSRVNTSEGSRGTVLVVDVHRGLEAVPRGTVKRLRLVGIPAKTHPTMNSPEMGLTRDDPGKFVLGTVPVEEDGSAHFHVPAGVAFFLQALDAQGMAVQTMRSATYLQPGQTATCVGCHEPRNTAPPNALPAAFAREPSKITPDPAGSWPLDYQTLVQPVLEARCVTCHRPEGEASSFDLTAGKSYQSLVDFGSPSLKDHVLARYQEGRSVAGACAAQVNPLWQLLAKGHYGVELDADQRARLIVWMDTYGQRSGSFDERQQRELRALRHRLASILSADP
jgi:mono/diheme cytochrome c family protein